MAFHWIADNPPGPGREGDYNRQEGGYGGPPGRGGYGYNRGGYRGRGGSGRGYGSRPGMGRDFEHGEHGPEMGRGGPWMGECIVRTLETIIVVGETDWITLKCIIEVPTLWIWKPWKCHHGFSTGFSWFYHAFFLAYLPEFLMDLHLEKSMSIQWNSHEKKTWIWTLHGPWKIMLGPQPMKWPWKYH